MKTLRYDRKRFLHDVLVMRLFGMVYICLHVIFKILVVFFSFIACLVFTKLSN